MIESFKEDINNSLIEIQENAGKPVKELNKAIQDLKGEVETIKKTQAYPTHSDVVDPCWYCHRGGPYTENV